MEKLIELLNQFEEEKKSDNRWGLSYDNELLGLSNIREARLSVISKEYGFIQRLYDKGFAYWKSAGLLEDMYVDDYSDRKSTVVDATIMKLSIEDEPIKFLISILK